ncbi:MAG: hypothetical protein H7270_11190, partial [Dermatophilaceae bacterium]|nr:hypothetical protein [Dermatophilaceae bacterium]
MTLPDWKSNIMRRTPALIVAGLVAAAVTAIGAPAQAATNTVTIRLIASQTTAVDSSASKVTIKPSVTKSGKVRLRASRLTVTQGSGTLVRNKNAAAVAAGSYKVTTTVKYKTYTTKKGKKNYSHMKTKAFTQALTIYGPCAKPADFASVKVQPVP